MVTASDRVGYESIRKRLDKKFGPGTSADFPALGDFEVIPATKPLYTRLLVDDEGYLWIQQYPDVWEGFVRIFGPGLNERDFRWWLFSPSGRLMGIFSTPKHLVIQDVRNATVVAIARGVDDVEQVYLLRLEKPSLGTTSAR